MNEGLNYILNKQEIISTVSSEDLITRPDEVQYDYQKHAYTHIPLGDTDAIVSKLLSQVNSGKAPVGAVVAPYGYGKTSTVVSESVGLSSYTVGKWRRRFLETGLDGLLDEPRPGVLRKMSDADVERVLTLTLETTPPDAAHWSTRSMARCSGLSQSAISRIWRAFATLKNAHIITSKEAIDLFSHVRLGVDMDVLKELSIQTVNKIFIIIQPAHLQKIVGKVLSPEERDVKRAEIIRNELGEK